MLKTGMNSAHDCFSPYLLDLVNSLSKQKYLHENWQRSSKLWGNLINARAQWQHRSHLTLEWSSKLASMFCAATLRRLAKCTCTRLCAYVTVTRHTNAHIDRFTNVAERKVSRAGKSRRESSNVNGDSALEKSPPLPPTISYVLLRLFVTQSPNASRYIFRELGKPTSLMCERTYVCVIVCTSPRTIWPR